MKYYRLNYEISSWLPKGSIWSRDSSGFWKREDTEHTIGVATNSSYWFANMLEQEAKDPSDLIIDGMPREAGDDELHILTEVNRVKIIKYEYN